MATNLDEFREFVDYRFQEMAKRQDRLEAKIDELRNDLTWLKIRAMALGIVGGLIGAAGTLWGKLIGMR